MVLQWIATVPAGERRDGRSLNSPGLHGGWLTALGLTSDQVGLLYLSMTRQKGYPAGSVRTRHHVSSPGW